MNNMGSMDDMVAKEKTRWTDILVKHGATEDDLERFFGGEPLDCRELDEQEVLLHMTGNELKAIVNGLFIMAQAGGQMCENCDKALFSVLVRSMHRLHQLEGK